MEIKIGTQRYSIPSLALGLMLAAILAPSVKYSLNLHNPSAAELLVAISIALFSSVLFLWILDATSILKFRSEWISKSIYGAAIVSVIGTSVGVYKDYFDPNKYPYSSKWELAVLKKRDSEFILNNNIALVYSEHSKLYWGYSEINKNRKDSTVAIAAEMLQFDEKSSEAILKIIFLEEKETIVRIKFNKGTSNRELSFTNNEFQITLKRPNY